MNTGDSDIPRTQDLNRPGGKDDLQRRLDAIANETGDMPIAEEDASRPETADLEASATGEPATATPIDEAALFAVETGGAQAPPSLPIVEKPLEAGAPSGQLMQLAAFGARFWAFMVDVIVIGLVNAILFNLVSSVTDNNAWYDTYFNINYIFLGITGSAYFVLMTRYFGQTLGKMIMGIRVVQRDSLDLDWNTVLFRELVGRTLSQLFGTWIGYLIALFTPRHVALHDLVADTYVVKEEFAMDKGFVKIPMK